MTEGPEPPLSSLLNRLRFVLAEPVDFTRTDTETTIAKVRLLTAAATYFNVLAVGDFGGRFGTVREPGLVEQVVGAAFQSYAEEDPHPAPFDKAAMLLRGITQGHPFNDGNKRTGFLVAAYFLQQVGHPFPKQLDVAAAEQLCVRISAGEQRDVDDIARELHQLWEPTAERRGT